MADRYWFIYDTAIVAVNDENVSLVFDLLDGTPVDVSTWTDMTYKASSDQTTDVINVAHATMTRTSSGAGITDTIIIPFADTDTDIATGLYNHEFSVKIAGDKRTIFRGTVRILEEIAEVP